MDYRASQVADPAWRELYERHERMFGRLAKSIEDGYGLHGLPLDIGFEVKGYANASAAKKTDRYLIRVANVFPYLLIGLFKRILADPEVMPWLPAPDNDGPTTPIQFVREPSNLNEEAVEQLQLPPGRLFAAELLAEIAFQFVVMHEVGHVLAGHLEVPVSEGGVRDISELLLVSRSGNLPLRRAWEIDADLIAVGLLDELISDILKAAQTSAAGGLERHVYGPHEISVAQATSLVMMAIHCLFRYVGETRTQIQMGGYHPDPVVRTFAVRNALIPRMLERHTVDRDLFDGILGGRFEEFDDALEALGIHSEYTLADEGIALVNEALSAVLLERESLVKVSRPFSFLETSY